MMRIAALVVALLTAGAALAEDAAPAPVLFRGERGLAPVPVVYDYLKDRIADEVGLSDYQTLSIKQLRKGEDREHVQVEVVMAGLTDDAIASQRYLLALHVEESGWVIDSAKQDWKCRRGGKGWTNKPCK
ncbi:hypothetical protein SAMN02745857_00295 [Andreprevotia lacus DSM 23236]|jgi:hypothetical protein|uniref:DUF3828 domain-containing protein n=1 Tax=Andreprevotia lacus DSM 23236 TaxID=1121001 RepID=A0A1W1WZ98_9NEIS|nr:hypothetical protein [Andreprevotia lacus]SMC16964.1 hypothetical protein SAMN02745857_00295 [Andreprevotia lacus DSM 23236]